MPGLCLDCRVVLDEGEVCERDGHRSESLLDDEGRLTTTRAAWSSPVMQPRLDGGTVYHVGVGAGSGAVIASLLRPGPFAPPDFLYIAAGALVGALLGALVGLRRQRPRQRPYGVPETPPPAVGRTVTGRVRYRGDADPSPISGAAYCIALSVGDPTERQYTAVYARSRGFEIVTATDETFHVPPGRVHLPVADATAVPLDLELVRATVRHIDAARSADELPPGRDPVPWENAVGWALRDGDGVELTAELEPEARSDSSTYRDTDVVFRAVPVPSLRRG